MGRTHMIGGAAAWAGLCAATGTTAVGLVAGGMLAAGAAAPWCDLDNLGAWSRRTRRGVRRTRRGVQVRLVRWRRHPVKSRLSWLVCRLGSHREGPCHSVLVTAALGGALAAAGAVSGLWPWWLGAAVGAGLVSHVGLDLLNERPVRVFWPFGRLWYGLGIDVGKAGETWLVRPACFAAAAGLFWLAVHR
jgi:hypothetical protein